jgi:nicotinate-nucleotide pyrophosphorylase (carboxylating)
MTAKEMDAVIARALKEDLPQGDITSESIIPSRALARAILLAKEGGILAGLDIARRVFRRIDPWISFNAYFRDGQAFSAGDVLAEIEGKARVLLKGERTALNFLQRLSGIATTTRKFVDAVAGTKVKILDTRKTTPGLRALEKNAVKIAGAENHRPNLSSMVLIKDNHLKLVDDVGETVRRARSKVKPSVLIEVEATDFEQAKAAVEAGADWIMLDNMRPTRMRKIVEWAAGRVTIEASGNVSLKNVRRIAATGVDYISVGRLTHSYRALDLSLEFLGPLPKDVNRVELPPRRRRGR